MPGRRQRVPTPGNTSDNRQITTVGFLPDFMLIKTNGTTANGNAAMRMRGNSGDQSFVVSAGLPAANLIQNFLSNGFEVGNGVPVNDSGQTMYFYAIKGAAVASTRRPIPPIIFQ